MKTIYTAMLAAILIGLTAGCPLVDIDVEVEAVCTSVGRIDIDGIAGVSDMVEVERTTDISAEATEIFDALDRFGVTDATLKLTDFSVAVNDSADISFVDALSFRIRTPARPELPTLAVYACEDCPANPADIALSADPIELMAYVETGALELDTTVRGHLPEHTWSLSVDLCFESAAKLER